MVCWFALVCVLAPIWRLVLALVKRFRRKLVLLVQASLQLMPAARFVSLPVYYTSLSPPSHPIEQDIRRCSGVAPFKAFLVASYGCLFNACVRYVEQG